MEENSRDYIRIGILINVIVLVGFVVLAAKAFQPGAGAIPQRPIAVAPAPAAEAATSVTTIADSAPAAELQPVIAGSADLVAPAPIVAAFNKGGCAGCHVIPGIPGANGQIGPNLTQIGVEGANRVSGVATEQYIRESILDPNAVIAPQCPNGACPANVMLQSFAQMLSADDLDTIVGYLTKLGTGEEATLLAAAAPPIALAATLPAEAVLEPFMALPKEAAKEAQIALGKYLFFDPRLSGNNSLSCASCHQPDNAFADGLALSKGYPSTQYFRNTPTVMNTVFATYLYRDGRMDGGDMPTLVRDHLTEAHFMSIDSRLMAERLKQVPAYNDLFTQAYGGEPSFGRVLNAITAYVQTLNSPPVAYDRYLAGDQAALSADAAAGLTLFEGKASCASCHAGALLADGEFYNTGVGTDVAMLQEPERHLTFRRFFRILGTPDYRNLREDVGLYALTLDEADWGKFRTPSLREVGRTAPYMHDGSLADLETVVQFYNQGGGDTQTAGLQPLNLSDDEVAQLVAFLASLSSEPVAVEPPQLPDYALLPLGDATAPPSLTNAPAEPAATTASAASATQPATAVVTDTAASGTDTAALDIEAVTAVVMKGTCNACHTIPGIEGAVGIVGPNLAAIGAAAADRIAGYTAEQYIHESIVDPNAFIAPQCPFGACVPGSMPATLVQTLSEAEISLVVDYLLTLRGGQ